MDKIYKDYEDQYIANNIIYAAALPSETKLISGEGIIYAFASEESCIKDGKPVSAVKIDKDTLLDRVLKGAIVCSEDRTGVGYFIPIGARIEKTNNSGIFTVITTLNAVSNGVLTIRLVSSEANLDELGNSGAPSGPGQWS